MKHDKRRIIIEDNKPIKDFCEIVNKYEAKLNNLKNTTNLPASPDIDKVMELVELVNGEKIYNKNAEVQFCSKKIYFLKT